jgi:hypothetical protein
VYEPFFHGPVAAYTVTGSTCLEDGMTTETRTQREQLDEMVSHNFLKVRYDHEYVSGPYGTWFVIVEHDENFPMASPPIKVTTVNADINKAAGLAITALIEYGLKAE